MKEDRGWMLQSCIWGELKDNCVGMEGEWDKGVRKGEKEIRVTVSKSGRDMRDVQSLYIHVE